MLTYNSYFDKFPKVSFKVPGNAPDSEILTNIFFRIGFIKETLSNISSYYTVELEDGDTPEILADKVYDDSGAGWIILLANQILDPQFDWPLDSDAFDKYIIGKYGSIENSMTTVHHYEMVITRVLSPDNTTTTQRYVVNKEKLTDNNLDVPYNYYQVHGADPGSLANVQEVNTYNLEGKTIVETIDGEAITNYDYEVALNDSRRLIRVIKKEYYPRIMSEYNKLTDFKTSYSRRVI
jgi:hypothetical protein